MLPGHGRAQRCPVKRINQLNVRADCHKGKRHRRRNVPIGSLPSPTQLPPIAERALPWFLTVMTQRKGQKRPSGSRPVKSGTLRVITLCEHQHYPQGSCGSCSYQSSRGRCLGRRPSHPSSVCGRRHRHCSRLQKRQPPIVGRLSRPS